jgi:hypothetical protein
MLNASIVKLAHAYRSIGCTLARISEKFGVSRRDMQRALQIRAPLVLNTQASFSRSTMFGVGLRKDP